MQHRSAPPSVKGHRAASTVLEELADSTEQAALTSALVYRYIQAHSLWKGHPDPKVTSAETTFLDTLDTSMLKQTSSSVLLQICRNREV
jgi:cytidylate kinase